MKNILIFLFLTASFAAFAQDQDEAEYLSTEENFEQEMFMMKQEEISTGTAEISEDQLAEEEVYDSDVDYND